MIQEGKKQHICIIVLTEEYRMPMTSSTVGIRGNLSMAYTHKQRKEMVSICTITEIVKSNGNRKKVCMCVRYLKGGEERQSYSYSYTNSYFGYLAYSKAEKPIDPSMKKTVLQTHNTSSCLSAIQVISINTIFIFFFKNSERERGLENTETRFADAHIATTAANPKPIRASLSSELSHCVHQSHIISEMESVSNQSCQSFKS